MAPRVAEILARTMEAAERPHDDVLRRRRARDPADRMGSSWRGGRALNLSVREFGCSSRWRAARGRIVPREDLYARVWGGPLRGGDRSIDVYVHKLRVKLEEALPDWRFIHTHVGFGYRFSPEPSHAFHMPATGR